MRRFTSKWGLPDLSPCCGVAVPTWHHAAGVGRGFLSKSAITCCFHQHAGAAPPVLARLLADSVPRSLRLQGSLSGTFHRHTKTLLEEKILCPHGAGAVPSWAVPAHKQRPGETQEKLGAAEHRPVAASKWLTARGRGRCPDCQPSSLCKEPDAEFPPAPTKGAYAPFRLSESPLDPL